MRVEVFSDVVCPWCYIGKRRLETAVANLAAKGVTIDLEITYRPYQLDPTAPRHEPTPVIDAYAKKFGGQKRAVEIIDHVSAVAAQDGIKFNMDKALRANTALAHRLLGYALREYGTEVQSRLKERLLRAYFEDGLDIGGIDVLAACAQDVSVDRDLAAAYLGSDAGVSELADELLFAAQNDITAVPTFIFDDKWIVPGAQDVAVFERILMKLSEKH